MIVPGLCGDQFLRKTWLQAHGYFGFHVCQSRVHDPFLDDALLKQFRTHDLGGHRALCT
jgi:hypothetical protein